jgi:hypothetical protein
MLYTKNIKTQAGPEPYELDNLYKNSRSGLWAICIYLIVTLIAACCKDQSLATILPPHLMQKLGAVPPVYMAVVVLLISTLSALTVIAGRLFHNTEPSSTRSQLAFRIGFYILFFVVGGLGQWFNELFVSGLVVLALQHYNVSSYYTRAIDMNLAIYRSMPQASL